ncbi:hypothetical protein [Spiroplasma endosymbiont of Aspidapion aeneum]|uniref:hypothetical protein n=1 Tax=Spiroplasma endosymbiont of Aspidapion aeneum TaxID=3066276 RepID=UPI00313E462D
MGLQLIIIIILFAIWVIALFIFFLLAYLYHLSHYGFKEKRDEIFSLLKTTNDYQLTPIHPEDIKNFILDDGELLYKIEKNSHYFLTNKKKAIKRNENETLNNCFYLMLDFFKIGQNKIFVEYINLFITSSRLILENKEEFIVIPFSKIRHMYYSLKRYIDEWKNCLIVLTEKNYYQIIVNDYDTFLILRKIYSTYLD